MVTFQNIYRLLQFIAIYIKTTNSRKVHFLGDVLLLSDVKENTTRWTGIGYRWSPRTIVITEISTKTACLPSHTATLPSHPYALQCLSATPTRWYLHIQINKIHPEIGTETKTEHVMTMLVHGKYYADKSKRIKKIDKKIC